MRLGARHGVCQQGDAVPGGAAARGRQLAGGGGHAAARWAVVWRGSRECGAGRQGGERGSGRAAGACWRAARTGCLRGAAA